MLKPIQFERDGDFNAGEQSKIIDIIRDNQALLLNEWEKVYPPEGDNNDE